VSGTITLPFDLAEVDYTRYSNRQLAAIPLGVLFAALVVIAATFALTGAPVDPGVEFTGGTELRVAVDAPSNDAARDQIQSAFSTQPEAIQSVAAAEQTYIVTFEAGDGSGPSTTQLEQQAESAGFEILSIDAVGPSFGADTQQTALFGVVVAFLGMSLLVFAMFRSFVPSIAVVISAFSDIVIPVALMNLLGIELSLGTVAALLMIIGYSVDSDILLNNHVIRRSGSFYESVASAMRTGVTMTLTSLAAMVVMTITATLFGIQLLASIGIILVFGLTADLMNTYMLNLSLLRWWKFEGVSR
jgi:preprotein translocase subunit SecF